MSLLRDVRALGAGAIPRAVYEASKRTGAHALLFGTVSAGGRLRPSKLARVPAPDSPAGLLCLGDAECIVAEGLLVFGRRVPIRTPSDWVTDPESGETWPQQSWWTIDIRTDRRLGDVKWVWEMGRHRDLVVLARAAAIAPAQPDWAAHLDRLLVWWCEANPLERSIHWYSNLEIALRLIAWDQVVALAGPQLPRRTLDLVSLHVAQMRRHLWRDLPYTLSSMRNNHMLGDAIGLSIADSLTDREPSPVRTRIATRIWQDQLLRQVNPDGSMIEDSLSYHRFALEMLCVRYLCGDHSPLLTDSIGRCSRYLANLGALHGPVPQYGDWDEGRVLTTSGDPLDVGNSVALGLAIAGEPEALHWRERFDLLDWYLPAPSNSRPNERSRPVPTTSSRVGDIAAARRGDWHVWLKCGAGPSHGHADLGHVSVRFKDKWVVTDPGTGTYNGPLDVRDGFRTSHGHNVLRPLGEGQIEGHRAFRWMSAPEGRAGQTHDFAEASVIWGAHDAYVQRGPSPWPWRMARACVVTSQGLVVIDWREGTELPYELTVPLGPDCSFDGRSITLGESSLLVQMPGSVEVAVGERSPFAGWFSRTYGSWEPSEWLLCKGSHSGPVIWSIGDVESNLSERGVHVDGIDISVTWTRSSVTLHMTQGSQHIEDTVSIGRST